MRFRFLLPSVVGLSMLAFISSALAFGDVGPQHPSYAAIHYVGSQGIMQGYGNGMFHPDTPITRAEFTAIVMGIHPWGIEASECNIGHSGFSDVHDNAWYAMTICKALYKGILQGNGHGMFYPDAAIRYKEAAKIAIGAYGFPTDWYGMWYTPYVDALNARGAAIANVTGDHFLTRGETAEMIGQLEWFMHDKDRVEKMKDMTPVMHPPMMHEETTPDSSPKPMGGQSSSENCDY